MIPRFLRGRPAHLVAVLSACLVSLMQPACQDGEVNDTQVLCLPVRLHGRERGADRGRRRPGHRERSLRSPRQRHHRRHRRRPRPSEQRPRRLRLGRVDHQLLPHYLRREPEPHGELALDRGEQTAVPRTSRKAPRRTPRASSRSRRPSTASSFRPATRRSRRPARPTTSPRRATRSARATASVLIQQNFFPGETDRPGGPLFDVQIAQLVCSDINTRQSVNQITDTTVADDPTDLIGPRRLPVGFAGDPGGIPLYKDGVPDLTATPVRTGQGRRRRSRRRVQRHLLRRQGRHGQRPQSRRAHRRRRDAGPRGGAVLRSG